jgi:hypothetical protein
MGVITMRALALALLYCSGDLQGRRSMETLLRCLGVDTADKEKAERAKAEVLALSEDIEDCFDGDAGGGAGGGAVCEFSRKKNPYPANSIAHYIWESLRPGDWRDWQYIQAFVGPQQGVENPKMAFAALNIVANPWNPGNGGSSFLRQTRNQNAKILYRLEFSIPKAVHDLCIQVLGPIPVQRPRVLAKIKEKIAPQNASIPSDVDLPQQVQQQSGR